MAGGRWIIVGAGGMLGTDVRAALERRGCQVTGYDRNALDVSDPVATLMALAGADVVVNCAAYTAVDAAETHEAEAFAVNALGAHHVAVAARAAGARLIHISTDYVFGSEAGPEAIPEEAALSPRSAYGRTKAAGEWAVRSALPESLVVRTAWLYGVHGACFPRTIHRLLSERGTVSVVDDQFGQPTWTADLAELLWRLVDMDAPGGIYHGTAGGATSWWEFATAVAEEAGISPGRVNRTTTADFARPAPRPTFSVLGHARLRRSAVPPIGGWRSRLQVAAEHVLGVHASA